MEAEDLDSLDSPSRNDGSVGFADKVRSLLMPDLSKDLHHNGDYCRSFSSIRAIGPLSDASRKFRS